MQSKWNGHCECFTRAQICIAHLIEPNHHHHHQPLPLNEMILWYHDFYWLDKNHSQNKKKSQKNLNELAWPNVQGIFWQWKINICTVTWWHISVSFFFARKKLYTLIMDIVALHCTYSGHGWMYMVYEAIQEQDHLTFKRCKLHSNNNDNITIA